MAVLRSGRRLELDTNGNKEEAEGKAKKEEDQPDSATTQRVVFVGLLIGTIIAYKGPVGDLNMMVR